MDWTKVFYNGLSTNIEVTECGKVRRIYVDWVRNHWCVKIGEVDLSKIKKDRQGYYSISVIIKGMLRRNIHIHQLIASAFLDYKFNGHAMVVDHIDSNIENNNVTNLRVISQRENNSKEITIKSGLPTGVYLIKENKKYRAMITVNQRLIHLGCFDTIDEASNRYKKELLNIK